MTVETPNLPELKRLNMWVQKQDQLEPGARIWDQGEWVTPREETPMCQSAYCVAGMAIVRAGHKLTRRRGNIVIDDQYATSYFKIKGLAEDILGIGEETGYLLFDLDNSAADVDHYIRRIFEKAEVDYDSVEPAPDLEIEIKASEAAQQHLNFINA